TTCPNPGVPENGQQIVDPGMDVGISRTFILNDQVLFRCNDGYKLIGSGSITCTYRRAWTGPTPTCVPNVCSSIEVPHNGNKVHTTSVNGEVGYIIGDKVQFSCNPGFDLVGENEITCEEDLQWSHDVPTCR
uniref:CUB and sushi domain-containing protein 2-like n=1 Tax=Saccoglossus kowalevskii TaxID=10224 RepID=A0ABM0MWM5_SACKO